MPAVSEDPTDRSESTDSFFKPRKHDIVPIVLALLSIIACLTAGLTSFFVVGKNQYQESVSGLDVVLNSTLTQYSTALKSTSVVIDAVASFFQLSKTNVTLYDQFDPYMKLFM
jgi:capsular polysaccharide biosynthesis protein